MSKILVVGGAGYIGSHMVQMLHQGGIEPVVLDNLSTGFAESVNNAELVTGDLADTQLLRSLFSQHQFIAVVHFAAFSQVGESIQQPAKYYHNNIANTQNLLNAMCSANVKRLVFSSTAAVYGTPTVDFITEEHALNPINPYGRTKLAIEWMLQDYAAAYGLQSVALRYFNAAGAEPEGTNGERHDPETHLIPLVLQAASGRRPSIKVFGTDYPTQDGTCVRDYIHIKDLCSAHLAALEWLKVQPKEGLFLPLNLGNGLGFSVQQVIDTVKKVTGCELKVDYADRRIGDPSTLVANAEKAERILGWRPSIIELDEIVNHAWVWEQHMSETNKVCER